MAQLPNPALLVAAWHTQLSDIYDFSSRNQRIEVKSVSGRIRRHYFTLDQLCPVPETRVVIASILVERAGAGVSVADLVDQIRSKVSTNAELLVHIDQVVGLTLGNSWRSSLQDRFDLQLAETSLAFFEPMSIPKVNPDLPAGVSNVRFRADLTGVPTADTRALRAFGELFQAAIRR
jgi:hypothetical protein